MADSRKVTRISVVGSSDRQLDEMLRRSGAQVSSLPMEALRKLSEKAASQPDAIVLDLRERTEVPATLGALKGQHPQTGVVIVASRLDPALMLDAMRAGVTEWLAEPITATAATAAVRRVLAKQHHAPSLGQVFAFVGAKGGVGTTTLATNIAAALNRLTQSTPLLVDLHLTHGDAALFLGAEPKFSIIDAFENIHRLDQSLLQSLVSRTKMGVDLLASAERTTVTAPDPQHIRSLIEFVAGHYPYVVLDVPRADVMMLDSLEIASKVIVVTNQELATVRHTSRLALSLRQRYGADRIDVVMSRYDRTAGIGTDDVERVSGGPIRHLIPSDYRAALDSLNKGRPVVIENHSRLATSLTSLTRELAGLTSDKPAGDKASRLFGRLASVLG